MKHLPNRNATASASSWCIVHLYSFGQNSIKYSKYNGDSLLSEICCTGFWLCVCSDSAVLGIEERVMDTIIELNKLATSVDT